LSAAKTDRLESQQGGSYPGGCAEEVVNAKSPLVGTPVERIEDMRLLRGRGQFLDDLNCENQLHACVLRSSVAHGVLTKVDTSRAKALSGVRAVLTSETIGAVPRIPVRLFPTSEMEPFCQPVIAEGKVRFVGEPIALVVADTPGIAEDALDLIDVDIDPLPTTTESQTALLFDAHGSNLALEYDIRKGDADAAFASADYVRRERFYVHRHTGITMETRGVLAKWDAGQEKLTCWGATKVPFANRKILAAQLNLPESSVDMIEGDSGGSYGVKGEFFPEDFLVAYAAKSLNRPVKWIEDRREHLLAITHARDVSCELEIACTRDGKILGLRGRASTDIGAYFRTSTTIAPRNVGQFISGPYRISDIAMKVEVNLSNKSPTGTYRGPGRFEADFFRERLFDLVAKDLGIDRVEFRRRNLVKEEEMPYAMPTVEPVPNATALDSGVYEHVLDRCLSEAGWEDKKHLSGKLIDGRYHGLAVACFVEGGAAGPRENARIVLEKDGIFSVYVGSSAVGQGVQTILMQIAADALEVPFSQVRVFHGSTTYVKEGWGSYHSRSTVMGGSAILLAAHEIKAQMKSAAALRLNCSPQDLAYENGEFHAEDGRVIDLTEIGAAKIEYEATFHNTKHTYAYGSHVAHVAVDPRVGHIQIVDYVAVEDAGRIINPLTLHGQSIGAIVQGLGGTLLEHLVYDDGGQMLTGSLADYLVPLATDFPNLRSFSLGLRPSPNNPLGAKGAGEGGTIPVGGIIANAVADALSVLQVEPRELPLSPPKLWRLIRESGAHPSASD
jgi:carbon-monoxide dehydrogenase large subunit